MYTVFFRCLKQYLLICDKTIKLRHSCSSLLEHLWWEWSSNFDAYKEFALIYYYELGQMLHLFLSEPFVIGIFTVVLLILSILPNDKTFEVLPSATV